MREVIPGVYQLPNSFVNLYLILDSDGLTLVDTGLQKSGAAVVLAALEQLSRQPGDLKRILITHADPDHIGSVAALKTISGASVMIGRGDAPALARGEAARPPNNAVVKFVFGLMMPKSVPVQIADVQLEDGAVIPEVLGGLQVVFSPGHTAGHVAFFSPRERILFAGDAMTGGRKLGWGRGPFTLDYAQGLASVRKLEALHPTTVCCGHGDPVQGEALEFPR
jgi:glyoxylase-like metal-dependent hydrolase (beta-lactamase superfamily II)